MNVILQDMTSENQRDNQANSFQKLGAFDCLCIVIHESSGPDGRLDQGSALHLSGDRIGLHNLV